MVDPAHQAPELSSVLASAFGAGNGAYAWKKGDLPEVIDQLAAAGMAVVGGEIWGLRDFEIFGAVPTRKGHTRIFAWSAPPRAFGTDWSTYRTQCIQYALDAVLELNAEAEVAPAFRDHLLYHLQFLAEKDDPHRMC
jgi:hypothetical protein